jgi:hypothetical protein
LGGPSWDAFERLPGNPVCRGASPYEWPVNGFLFEDPVSGDWFVYVGEYCEGYAFKPDFPSRCVVFRSKDRAAHWESLGPVFREQFTFEGEVSPVSHAPDVSVTYADGRYHLCFDWTTDNTTWANAANPPADANSGVGYAWAERPEGPYHPTPRPLVTTRGQVPLLGKYRRLYASSLLRRANDWLVLTLTDSGPCFGWALLGMTASAPEGPYSQPMLLLHPETTRYHPPLLEFFPAFIHDGFVYAPATSVALNRNHQAMFRVPIERAMEPDAWELSQDGSVWHAEPVENEAFGIWGQTFSGFVGRDGIFNVMFPARDVEGRGTINLARRPWDRPWREDGLVISGHEGPSLACLKRGGPLASLSCTLALEGTITILWDHRGPLGADRVSSNATVHPLTLTRFCGLELTASGWALVRAGEEGARQLLAEGSLADAGNRSVSIRWTDDQPAELTIDGQTAFRGTIPNGPGRLALLAGKRSHAVVSQFTVDGPTAPVSAAYLYTGAMLGAAQNMAGWELSKAPRFRFGEGVFAKEAGVQAKWNFEGTGFTLWAPKGPGCGTAELLVDGQAAARLDFEAPADTASQEVFSNRKLKPGRHTVIVRALSAGVPVDSLDVQF